MNHFDVTSYESLATEAELTEKMTLDRNHFGLAIGFRNKQGAYVKLP